MDAAKIDAAKADGQPNRLSRIVAYGLAGLLTLALLGALASALFVQKGH